MQTQNLKVNETINAIKRAIDIETHTILSEV